MTPGPVRADFLVHQEGAIALVALVGLYFTERGVAGGLVAAGDPVVSLLAGLAASAVCVAGLWAVGSLPPMQHLERFQRRLVGHFTVTDAVVVALISGLAEEALLRALLQPMIGLVPASLIFALLHVVPDRRLWLWPVFAFTCGLGLGLLFDRFGYPAAAVAHVVINAVALLRLRESEER